MTTDTISGPTWRPASRVRRRRAVVALLIGAATVIAVGVGISFAGPLGDALARGELPTELLLIGVGGGLVAGLAITLIVGTVRGRHRGARPAADSGDVPVDTAPSEMQWPTEDQYSYAASLPASRPTPTFGATPSDSTWFDTHRTDDRARRDEEARVQAVPSSHTADEAPPVVNTRAEQGSRSRPDTPLAAVLGTVATGAAFALGAVFGAGVGVTVAAAIGIAFAVGAGAAVGATMLLLRSQRR